MILLYMGLLLALGLFSFLVGRRVAFLEWKYTRIAQAAARLLRDPNHKEGNSNKFDPCVVAKRQYLLGQLVQKRDRVEALHERWQQRADRLKSAVARVQDWKGKKLPYTCGVLDISCLLYLIDHLGVGEYVNIRQVLQLFAALLAG